MLEAAGAPPVTPVEGVDPRRVLRPHASATAPPRSTRSAMAADVVAAARKLVVGAHRDVGALVLECANMPPYRDAVAAATGLPVFDAAQLIAWFYAGVAALDAPRYARGDLW